ncbi:MAG: HAD family phosphatase [Bacteroidales bacterium]|nr:HAD family phosphatase [Bacteroidales bacterium]MDT8430142.1 HAD family phosphatase [Bacteroidales bacterium]
MIKAVIFDLDGTLIQTEVLKARSYARAIHQLTAGAVLEEKVLTGFNRYVGLSRMEVVEGLFHEFLPELAKVYPENRKVEDIQQSMLTRRLEIYQEMIADADLLSGFFCPFNIGLLHGVHADRYTTALATMSHRAEAERMLDAMQIKDKLSVVVTKDNVSRGKPDPEIYLKISEMLELSPEECLVIEDSVNGIKAGINAGMTVFAVTNDITRDSVHKSALLDARFIIDELSELKPRIYSFLAH